jgi:hypothetical protein
MANVKVNLYQSIKVAAKWTFRRVSELRLKRLSAGGYYITCDLTSVSVKSSSG